MHLARAIPLFALVALLLPPLAAAQTAPVLLERVDDAELVADVGAPATARFNVFNLNREDDFYVSLVSDAPAGWETRAEPNRFFLGPRNSTDILVVLAPQEAPSGETTITLTFHLVDGRSGAVTAVEHVLEVESGAPPRVAFGMFPNPLPPPLDNAYGSFLVEAAVSLVVAVIAVFLADLLIRFLTGRAAGHVTREIAAKVRRPVFYFVFFLGLARPLAVLPRNPVFVFIEKLLVIVAITFFGLQVLYRILDAALFYWQKEIAPRTQTDLDDILVPVVRKVGLVVIYILGTVVTLRNLGWDPTIVFAGAGIAGLVIAFAAQDTFSNLFSGLFLLLDRPFVEGDQIQLETGENARVESIGLRTTRLYNDKIHETIIVPNNQLATRRIINHSAPDRRWRVQVVVGVAYGTDPRKVERTLLDVAMASAKIIKDPPFLPGVRFSAFGESALEFHLNVFIPDFVSRSEITSELRFAIDEAFRREGIEIPFPHRQVILKDERKRPSAG